MSAATIAAVNDFVNNVIKFILTPLIYGMFGIAALVFVWGINNFVSKADDAEARSRGASQMLWGVLGMAIMIAAVALKNLIQGTVSIL